MHTIVQHGKSHNLFKQTAKRRRTKQQIKYDKDEDGRKNDIIMNGMARLEEMTQQIQQL